MITHPSRMTWAAGALAAAAFLAACGSSSKSSTAASTGAPAGAASTGAASSGAPAGVTFKTANVSGLGKVLVSGDNHTLYVLTSEKGGKVTCTDANGCTKIWPDSELPKGVTNPTAGSGVQASLLGTTKTATGDLYATYASYPLYTFSGDSGPLMANGEGINSFGGTWYAISPAGTLVTPPGASGTSSSSTTSGSGGGYGY